VCAIYHPIILSSNKIKNGDIMSPFWILLELRMIEVAVTTGAIDVQSSSQIVTTNKPTTNFYRLDALRQLHEAKVES